MIILFSADRNWEYKVGWINTIIIFIEIRKGWNDHFPPLRTAGNVQLWEDLLGNAQKDILKPLKEFNID